jgi:Leucine-rich repeat (LRR) protein
MISPFSKKTLAAILCFFSWHFLHSMEKPEKNLVLERFWQENNRQQIKNSLSDETVYLIERVVAFKSDNPSLNIKDFKKKVLNRYFSLADYFLMAVGSAKVNFPLGLQCGAYGAVMRINYVYLKEWSENLNQKISEEFFNELERQRHLINETIGGYNCDSYYSLRELHDHGCINESENYMRSKLSVNLRLNSLDGLDQYPRLKLFQAWHGGLESVEVSDIQKLTRLKKLMIRGHKLNSIDGISSLTTLTLLDLGSNRLKNIDSISGLKDLTCLDLHGNLLTDSNLRLQELTRLKELNLSNNLLTSLQSLSSLTQLRSLYIGENQILSLSESDLRPFNELRVLEAQKNERLEPRLNNIDGIYQLTKLRKLSLRLNAITEILPSIQHLTRLKKLDLTENSLTTLGPLVRLPALRELLVNNNLITEISSEEIAELGKLNQLHYLVLVGNKVSDETKDQIKKRFPFAF